MTRSNQKIGWSYYAVAEAIEQIGDEEIANQLYVKPEQENYRLSSLR